MLARVTLSLIITPTGVDRDDPQQLRRYLRNAIPTDTRSRPAPKPAPRCWRKAIRRTMRWPAGSTCFIDFLVTKHGLAEVFRSTTPPSRRCTLTSSTV
jgi:hypothetical protein